MSPTTGAVTTERVRDDCVNAACKDSWFYHRAQGRVSRFREHLDDRPLPPLPPLPRHAHGEPDPSATASGSSFNEDMDPNEANALLSQPAPSKPVRRRPNKLQKVRRKPLPPTPPPPEPEPVFDVGNTTGDGVAREPDMHDGSTHGSTHRRGASSVHLVVAKVGESVQAVLALPKAGYELVKNVAGSIVATLRAPLHMLPPLPPLPPMPSWKDVRGFASKGVGALGKGLGSLSPLRWPGTYKFMWR